MMILVLLLCVIILSAGTLNSVLLMVKPTNGAVDNKMFGSTLFFYNLYLLVYFLWFELEFILSQPHMFRTVSPLMYFTGPLFYFFVRNSLQGTEGLRKYDWIHFVPAVFHFVELMPLFFESSSQKLEVLQVILRDKSQLRWLGGGLIPIGFHYLFRTLLLAGYFSHSVVLFYRSRKQHSQRLNVHLFSNWFLMAMILVGWVVFSNLIYDVLGSLVFINVHGFSEYSQIFSFVALLGILLLNLYINFYPELVFDASGSKDRYPTYFTSQPMELQTLSSFRFEFQGIDDSLGQSLEYIPKNKALSKDEELIDVEEILTFKNRIVDLIQKDKIFRNSNLTLSEFSKQVGLSPKLVSYGIKQCFDKGFNEFINYHRVQDAIALIEEGFLDDYTMNGLCESVGFNSRSTFFNSFKKEMSCSPGEYWKNFQG